MRNKKRWEKEDKKEIGEKEEIREKEEVPGTFIPLIR